MYGTGIQYKLNIFKSFSFSLVKKGAGPDPKKSAPAPVKIKNLGSDRLRNTGEPVMFLICILLCIFKTWLF